jgi:hypothetical protein
MDTTKRAKRAKPRRKKTIRTMTPLARKMAHLTRAMQSNLKRLAYLTEELYELERAERAAQAQILGHASVCPLTKEPPAAELFPDIPNGEAIADGPTIDDAIIPCSASELEQGPPEWPEEAL